MFCRKCPARIVALRLTRHGHFGHVGASGFSLTEVAMAIAVVSFAFVALLALIPSSLQTFRHAIDTTLTSQIAQRLISEVQQTDFDFLVDNTRNHSEAQTQQFSRLPVRYYDDQGNELKSGNDPHCIYEAVIRVSQPGSRNPAGDNSKWFTSLPSTGARFNPRDMTIVTLEIVANPGNAALPFDHSTLLLDPSSASGKHLNYLRYSTIVARNGWEPSN
jgi:uncharacterized protein (TIGR02598 family)